MAAPRLRIANIETAHAWLAKRLRAQLLDILLERALGAEESERESDDETSHA